jgi:hypothetical protein
VTAPDVTTYLDPPSGVYVNINPGGTTGTVHWGDASQNETGFDIYATSPGGVTFSLLQSEGANATSSNLSGLTPSQWYQFYVVARNALVQSNPSNIDSVFTSDPPNAPSLLSATATATDKIRLNWTDNASNEIDQKIERSADGVTYAEIATVGANIRTYEATGLTSNTPYWFRVRARNDSGYSVYCTAATTSTWAAIAQPTGLTVTPWGAGALEIFFQDNSTLEDDHRLEQSSDGSTGWAEIKTLEPNRAFYRVTGLGNGTTRYFRVRAKQGASYSAYSDIVSGTTLSAPTAPATLVLSEIQDTSMRVSWTPGATDEAGFIIETSPDDATWTERGRTWKGTSDFLLRGLTASTLYYVRVCSYNAVSSSAYAASASETTLAAYSPSAFERVCNRLKPKLRFYIEANPAKIMQGWTLTTAQTYTYESAAQEKRIAFDSMTENGASLVEKTSIATVEATAGTWWYDTATRKMYVHATTGLDPVNYSYVGTFWFYASIWNTKNEIAEFNGNHYLPLVAQGGIPEMTASIDPIWSGSFSLSYGSVTFINGYRKSWGGYFFDTRCETWLWENRPIYVLAGAPGATYAELEVIGSAVMGAPSWSQSTFTVPLADIRSGLSVSIPSDMYDVTQFALMDSGLKDTYRPFGYGVITSAVPKCIDTTNRIFEFHNGRCKSVENVYQNGTALTVDTDYFVDYQHGWITLARGLTWTTSDIMKVDFTGHVDDADAAIEHGALIFIDLMLRYVGMDISELDLDTIYTTHDALTAHLGLYVRESKQSSEIVRILEQSCLAWSVQDQYGRIGFKRKATSAPSGVVYIQNGHVSGASSEPSSDIWKAEIVVNYAPDPSDGDRYSSVTKSIPATVWERRIATSQSVNTAHVNSTNANALADELIDELGKRPFSFTVPTRAWKLAPCDAFYLTKTRYPSSSGMASSKLMCVLSITRSPSGRTTTITAEAV